LRNDGIYRILDANLNRAREGLRVCEDILRFSFDDPILTRELKTTRHRIAKILKPHIGSKRELLRYREAKYDVGKDLSVKKIGRLQVGDLFFFNIQRSQESLRVLEEVSRIVEPNLESKFRKIRFKLYLLESKVSRKYIGDGKKKHK
jgi:thiamine-phosphate pyrophosphorylase